MNIVFVTNTFTPHVGGVARSIESFTRVLRERGHRVLITAPEFEDMPSDEEEVIRIPAIQSFNETDFSVVLPLPKNLERVVEDFNADIIHSHHPFLLGMTALRLARALRLPLVFTHHTLYEEYTHYVTSETELAARFIINLATSYANMGDQIVAPSESIADLLRARGVQQNIEVVPTGVEPLQFAQGNGARFRQQYDLSSEVFAVGHMGRLAPEKNLPFLVAVVIDFLLLYQDAIFILVGSGSAENEIHQQIEDAGVAERVIFTGILQNEALADAMQAMDVFCFASKSETQGMVLTEAMAAGLPVIALDAFGVRDVMHHEHNGLLVNIESQNQFLDALVRLYKMSPTDRSKLSQGALDTAEKYSLAHSVTRIENLYLKLINRESSPSMEEAGPQELQYFLARIKTEWEILRSVTQAGSDALGLTIDSTSTALGEHRKSVF